METDADLQRALKQLKEFAQDYYKGYFDDGDSSKVDRALSKIESYIFSQQSERAVQVDQVSSNILSIQGIMRNPPEEGQYPILSNHIDNLWRYSGAQI